MSGVCKILFWSCRTGLEVAYGACGTNIAWWTLQRLEDGSCVSLELSGAVKTGETDDVGAAHICVDRHSKFVFTANYGECRSNPQLRPSLVLDLRTNISGTNYAGVTDVLMFTHRARSRAWFCLDDSPRPIRRIAWDSDRVSLR